MLDLLVGFALISSLTLIAHAVAMGSGAGPLLWMLRGAGWLFEWAAWTIGLGAAVAVAVGGRAHVPPPAIPYPSPAPTIS